MSNCNCHNEIIHDGSGQLSRYLKALDPAYVQIDDRNIDDLLVYIKRYASQIRFYDIPGSMPDEEDKSKVSWREFFRRDMAVIIASVGLTNAVQVKKDYDELRAKIDLQPGPALFAELFSPIIGMAVLIDKWYSLAIPENPLYNDLYLAITSNLEGQLQKAREYEQGFLVVDPYHPLQLDFSSISNKPLWGLDKIAGSDSTIYEGGNKEDRIRNAALYADDIFHSFYGFIIQLIERSGVYLDYAVEKYPAHQPHMALFIAFLRLFAVAQDQLNGLTERMLNFYYRDVLHLEEKGSIPDRVYIVFELAKDVLTHVVAEGTLLKAGKDKSGKEQFYSTGNELVVNEAKVKELKTIFIQKSTGELPLIEALYARPVANSADGFGEKFSDPVGKWPTFGKGRPWRTAVNNICKAIDRYKDLAGRRDQAQIGFAIASPQLVLQGGNRLIRLVLPEFNKLFANKPLSIWFTSEEGWILIDLVNPELPNIIDKGIFNVQKNAERSYYITEEFLYVFLPVAEKAIIPFDAKLHKEFFYPSSLPVMQVLVGPEIGLDYTTFNELTFEGIRIDLQVGSINPFNNDRGGRDESEDFKPRMDGLTRFAIINDDGPVDTKTAYDPFTPFPQQGSSFYIGSDEVFNKPIYELTINIDLVSSRLKESDELKYQRAETDFLEVSVLTKGNWTELSREKKKTFTIGELTQNVLLDDKWDLLDDRLPILYNEEITDNSYEGFIKVSNLFSHFDTNLEFSQKFAKLLKTRKVSLSYISSLSGLEPQIDQVFHVYPFGVLETRPGNVPGSFRAGGLINSVSAGPVETGLRLLPQFTFTSVYSKYETVNFNPAPYKRLLGSGNIDWNAEIVPRMIEVSGLKELTEGEINQYTGRIQEEGILFIGLEKLKPLQSVSLLFQFAEGSAENEDEDPPPINWSYLVNNEWRPMKEEHIVSDGTGGFRATGIIRFDIPPDATVHHTIMTDGLIWLSASVTVGSSRVPMLVDVRAQVVEAKFTDNGNAPSHFDAALPAGSIGKLAVAVAEIGKVEQPFSSFDGKPAEIGKEFYKRVSERLRHKGRAITAWDYEHLILDRFPSIYKVKCITHVDPNCLCRNTPQAAISKVLPRRISFVGDEVATLTTLNMVIAEAESNPAMKITLVGYGSSIDDKEIKEVYDKLTKGGIMIVGSIDKSRIELKVRPARTYEPVVDIIETIDCCGPQIAPGHVLIIPIADLKNRNAVNPLQPKTSRRIMVEIEKYIKARTSPFVKVHVRNPLYEQVLVFFRVKFYPGVDKGYYLDQLNKEIVHYLTPWAFDANAEVKFGQKIYASAVINFIEERKYVDYITDFRMYVCRDECCPPEPEEKSEQYKPGEKRGGAMLQLDKGCGCSEVEYVLDNSSFIGETVAVPSTPRSILVSVPRHIILPVVELVKPSPCEERRLSKAATKTLGSTSPVDKKNMGPTAAHKKTIKKSRTPKKK